MKTTARTALVVAVGALHILLTGCDTGQPPQRSTESRQTEPPYVAAYKAGHQAGKSLYDAGGKGAAVREEVWGGCTRRALDAGSPESEADRGAWVQGCLDGVSNKPIAAPKATVTSRTEDTGLLRSFRTWAENHGSQGSVRHVSQLSTAQLTQRDYDVELTTDYTGANEMQARELARDFVMWWDSDHGVNEDSTARNVLILGHDGKMLVNERI
ncbi:hypothetical protein ACGF5F_09545 [Streptomyces sp. NPDC047821]|uniref:hypothetical protein n=1 Tax=unclassified Streptomyces TaxID=2593676 RepID=UPI003629C413